MFWMVSGAPPPITTVPGDRVRCRLRPGCLLSSVAQRRAYCLRNVHRHGPLYLEEKNAHWVHFGGGFVFLSFVIRVLWGDVFFARPAGFTGFAPGASLDGLSFPSVRSVCVFVARRCCVGGRSVARRPGARGVGAPTRPGASVVIVRNEKRWGRLRTQHRPHAEVRRPGPHRWPGLKGSPTPSCPPARCETPEGGPPSRGTPREGIAARRSRFLRPGP